ncbi:hypothetical protein [Streptomyces cylindrosporus]|uniref:Holin n=1 Tax=Streptomyces cylindrosporus TaxID=2927583 RepID=A0ABS9Y508_9ACTN|nr:hypothetical protein [Streptomyces cylindrosporus]MCI3272310.1 hypothetical protein [Streptomyces cylindrosporus]
MMRAWILPTLLVLGGSAVATGQVFKGSPGTAAALLLVFLALAGVNSVGAAAVRAANDGNETVPTVVVAGRPHTNPDPEWVREQLSQSV